MFAVVEWLYERHKEVSVVPLSWILTVEGQKMSYWPPGSVKSQSIIKTGQPPSTSWPMYPVSVLKTEGRIAQCCS